MPKNIKKIEKKQQIVMALTLANFYTPDFPSWPEVMGIYGIELPKRGHIVDWYMQYNVTSLKKIQKIKFQKSTIYLIPQFKSKNYLLNLISIFIYQIRLFLLLLKVNKKRSYNVLQARDDVFSGITLLITKKLLHKPLTFNYSFPYYEATLDHYRYHLVNKIQLLNYQIQDIILKKIVLPHSEYIFPISSQMKKNLKREGFSENKMHPLTEGVEPEIFKVNDNRFTLRKKLGIQDTDFVFAYIGSLGMLRGMDLIVDSFEIVVKKYPNAKLLLVGSNPRSNILKDIIKTRNLDQNVIFTGQIPYVEVPNFIDISDVCLSIVRDLPSFHVSSPCKIFEYLAIGKPVLANREIPEQLMAISESKGGVATKYDKTDLSNSMINYMENKSLLKEIGERGKKWVIKNRSFKVMTIELEKIYLNIISKNE
jgi:glycosyltransferase involved in cell wall biosynthesis